MSKIGLSAGRPSADRKAAAMKAVSDVSEKKMVRVNFELDEDEHTRLKIHLAKARRSLADLMRELIQKHVD